MKVGKLHLALIAMMLCVAGESTSAQESDEEFGPVVRAYLGYLRAEQEVVDDRVSRHEVSPAYYRRNSNRIRALREMVVKIARETENDYVPELEAVAADEFKRFFEEPPRPSTLRQGMVLNNTYRFLGTVRTGDLFYLFARLDPYEQADLLKKKNRNEAMTPDSASETPSDNSTRIRRVTSP